MVFVFQLSVGVDEGECFGLLGANGAGKTSTFKILTGEELMSSGNAYLNKYSVLAEMGKVGLHQPDNLFLLFV